MQWKSYLTVPGLASALIVIAGLALAQSPSGMMGRGTTSDGYGHPEATDDGIQGCMGMMQSMGRGHQRPNEQWRQQ